LKVIKEAVSEGLFDPACCPQEEIPPDTPETPDPQSKDQDLQSVEEKASWRNHSHGEVIDGMFDDPRDEKLEDIDNEQSDEADQDLPSVFNKVTFESFKDLHSFCFRIIPI
jgi:hypothetical protein